MIGDVDALHAFVAGQRSVFSGPDPFQNEPDFELVADASHVGPIERSLKLHSRWPAFATTSPPRLRVAFCDVALAAAVDRAVHGDTDGVIAQVHGLMDLTVDPVGVTARVQLKDLRTIGGLANRLHPRLRYGAEDERNAERGSGTRRRQAAIRGQSLQAANRR